MGAKMHPITSHAVVEGLVFAEGLGNVVGSIEIIGISLHSKGGKGRKNGK